MGQICCPACKRWLQAPEGCTGLAVQCAACQHTFTAGPIEPTTAAGVDMPPDETSEAPERFPRPEVTARGDHLLAAAFVAALVLLLLAAWWLSRS